MQLRKLNSLHALGLLLILAMALAACTATPTGDAAPGSDTADTSSDTAADTGSDASADGDTTLRIIYWQAASIPNPYLSTGTKDIDAASITLEPLAIFNEVGDLEPRLATEIPTVENGGISEDLMSITWTLREGVLWSDGTPFTADDVVFTYNYCVNPDTGCGSLSRFEGVESVEAVDDLTVLVTFTEPKAYPYDPFTSGQGVILNGTQFAECIGAAAQSCSDENLNPLGTGAFAIEEFVVDDVVTYVKNENYRDADNVYFERVIFDGGGDAAAAARAVLETGEADYAWNLQLEPEILDEMAAAGNGEVVSAFAASVERILLNMTNPDPALGENRAVYTEDGEFAHPFLTNPVIRHAMSMAVDRNIIAEQLYGAGGLPTCYILPALPDSYEYSPDENCLEPDIDGANAMLDEAGLVDSDGDGVREYEGIPLKVLYQTSTNSVRQKTQALVKQAWSEIGIDAELRNVDASVFFGGNPDSPDTFQKFFADVEMYTSSPSGADPQLYFSNFLCNQIPTPDSGWLGSNIPRFCNPEFDELFLELASTADFVERGQIALQLNEMLTAEWNYIPLTYRGGVSAYSNNLTGVKMNDYDSEMWNIQEWARP